MTLNLNYFFGGNKKVLNKGAKYGHQFIDVNNGFGSDNHWNSEKSNSS